jgi:hypothetical protein
MEDSIKRYPTSYPSDVKEEEWEFCAPYVTLMREDAPRENTVCERCSMR